MSGMTGVLGARPGTFPGLVSVDELAVAIETRAPILVLDARFTLDRGSLFDEYLTGHIPGALFVDLERELSGPRVPGPGSYPVPDAADFARRARSWGLDEGAEVVAYSGYTGISAGRLSWLLRWFGHERVRVLDGGLQAWERRGYPLVQEPGVPGSVGDFTARPGGIPVIDAAEARSLGARGQLVDVRARSQYRLRAPDPGRGGRPPGRIPGAVNVPSTSLHHRNGTLRDPAEIDAVLTAAGVDPTRPVGVYCGGGVASAWAAFVLCAAGLDAALFTASWSEYIADPTAPVEVEP